MISKYRIMKAGDEQRSSINRLATSAVSSGISYTSRADIPADLATFEAQANIVEAISRHDRGMYTATTSSLTR